MEPGWVWYDGPRRLLFCVRCTTALRPGGASVGAHFRAAHRVRGEALAAVTAYAATLPLCDPHTAPLPDDGSAPLPRLPRLAGYRCLRRGCGYRTTNRTKVSHHACAGAGQDGKGWGRATLQAFARGRYARYWIVADDEANGDT
jgi:hypothetical protein